MTAAHPHKIVLSILAYNPHITTNYTPIQLTPSSSRSCAMPLGKDFKPDVPPPIADEVHKKIAQKIASALQAHADEKEKFIDTSLRALMPGFVVDRIVKWNSMLPARCFGVSCEIMCFAYDGREVIVVRRFGKPYRVKMFRTPFWMD